MVKNITNNGSIEFREIKKVYIPPLARAVCHRRRLDATRLKNYLEANGCLLIDDPGHADAVFLITCAYKESKIKENIALIKKLTKCPGELIVLGCLPGTAPKIFKREFRGRSLPTKDFDKIDAFFPHFKVKFNEIPDANQESD